jgi:hypothetical protein
MDFSILAQLPAGLIAMLGGVILLYASAQSLSGAVPQAFVDSPRRRAFWHAGPIAAAAVVAACLGHGEMALGILTGCSVAALSLAPGVCRVLSSTGDSDAQNNPLGVLLLGPTLMLWLIGLRAEINWLAGVFLAVQGILLLWIWREPFGSKRPSILKGVIFLLATGVAAVAAVLAIRGAVRLHDDLPTLTPGIFSAGIIAPILILPMLGESVRLTEEHRAGDARTMQVGMAIINLAVILPLCVLASYFAPHFFPAISGGALPFPLGTWRIDCVVLVILAAWIFSGTTLPRWARQMEGVLLIVLYGAYLISLARVELFL